MNPQVQAILDKLRAQDEKIRYAIFAVVLLFIFAVDFFGIVNFQLGSIKSMQEEIKKIRDDSTRVTADIQRVQNVQKSLEDMKTKLLALNSKIHTAQEMPAIFEQISRTANEFHVNIDQLTPSKEPEEVLATGPDGKYYALPIVITAHCGYHMFNRFLGKLESSDLLFLVRDLKMDGADKDVVNIAISATLKIVLVDRDDKGAVKK